MARGRRRRARRIRVARETVRDRLWAAIRRTRRDWTCAQLAARAGASGREARRFVAALRAARLVRCVASRRQDAAGRYEPATWRTLPDPPAATPQLLGIDGAAGLRVPSGMTGAALRRVREQLGITRTAMTRALGLSDLRTYDRMEQRWPPPEIAQAARLLQLAG